MQSECKGLRDEIPLENIKAHNEELESCCLTLILSKGWKDGSVVKSAGCSPRGPGFTAPTRQGTTICNSGFR